MIDKGIIYGAAMNAMLPLPIPTRPRRAYTPEQREEALRLCGCICHLCALPIQPGQDWEMSHADIPHVHGGREVAPAHWRCHLIETSKRTIPMVAKVKRQRRQHNGAQAPTFSMPCSRRSKWRKKIAGGKVARVHGFERDQALRDAQPFLDFSQPPVARQITETAQ